MQKTNCSRGKKCLFREAIFYQMAWKKRDVFFLSTNVLSSEPSHLVPQKKKNHVYTTDIEGIDWADQLRSFYFQLQVIPHKNGTGISFDFHLIFQFVIVLFLTWSITQIKETKKGTHDQLLDSSGITTDQWFYPKQEESKITGDSKSTCALQKNTFQFISRVNVKCKCKVNVKHRKCLANHPSQRLMIKGLTIPDRIRIGNVGFWGEGKTGVPGEKPLRARKRANNKLNPHTTPGLGIEPGTHWWEASTLTTAPSLLPEKVCSMHTGWANNSERI